MANELIKPPKYTPVKDWHNTIFLAGGISNCPNWQNIAVDLLQETSLTIINPRNDNYSDSPESAEAQIKWEYYYITRAEIVLFWFPQDTLCPITLFEYGRALVGKQRLYVGNHPGYQRKLDLKIQTRLERPELVIHHNLYSLLDDVITNYPKTKKIGFV